MSKKTLGLWFQNKLKSKFTFGKSVATLNEGEDQKYNQNETITRLVLVDLKILKRRWCMKEPRMSEKNLAQHSPWLMTSIVFCYEKETPTGTDI